MDAVSYAHSAKQAQRIEKFIENPDSTSGIVTVPKTIPLGETITIPTGRVAVLPNIVVDGDLVLDGDIFIPTGSSVDFSNGIKVNGTNIALSIPTSYHLLSGNLSVDNTVLTNGFGLYLYTGNTTTLPSINLGMDITSGDNGYLIKIKSRSAVSDWTWVNSVRGITKYISSNTTAVEGTDANMFTLSTVAGVTTLNIGTSTRTNTNGVTYVVEVYQTTHKKTGLTNQGKAFTEHYNPDTGFTINGYEGSGLAGHEIPHSLGRKLGLRVIKNLSGTNTWLVGDIEQDKYLLMNTTSALTSEVGYHNNSNDVVVDLGLLNSANNSSANQYIMFGYRNSYFDESGKLIGNFEIGVYQGTSVAGNKVTTKGKPAWNMIKRLDVTGGSWNIFDNIRITPNVLFANLTNAEAVGTSVSFNANGFSCDSASIETNTSGGQYLYMIVYDNDNGSGKSKYYKATDTANVQINNGIIPLAHGIDVNGSKNSIVVANETITGLTYTEGKNYIYKTDTGYGVKPYKPRYLASELIRKFAGEQPDYYDVESNKWFNCDAGTELVANGNFNSGTTAGWTIVPGASSTITVSLNSLKIVNTTGARGYLYQQITVEPNRKYKLSAYTSGNSPVFRVGTSINSSDIASKMFTVEQYDYLEFNSGNNSSLYLAFSLENDSRTTYFDNISIFPVDIVPTTEITESRNYMNHIVHADADGGVLYVEELPKIEYKNAIKAEEYLGKNACTAWVNFDGTTTPPTIIDSYNVSAVIRTATGYFDIYFKKPMDNTNYGVSCSGDGFNVSNDVHYNVGSNNKRFITHTKLYCATSSGTGLNLYNYLLEIKGGRN